MESEYCEITARNISAKQATIVRAVNGTTAAAHANGTQIDLYRVPPIVKQAVLAQAMHQFNQAQAGFHDSEARVDLGKLEFVKSLHPSVIEMLMRGGMIASPLPYGGGF